jgi:hypothetical protein
MPDRSRSRTGALLQEVRRQPLFRQLVPMEAGIGWPIPVRRKPRVYLRLPLFGLHREDGRTLLSPPFATVTVDTDTGRPAEYQDLRFTRPWDPAGQPPSVGEFPHDAVRAMSTGDYAKARERLLECYDGLVASLVDDSPFVELEEFAELLGRLVEPSLLPYFRALGPRFYERFLGPGQVAQ